MAGRKFFHIIVRGRVQGIGYRWFVRETGQRLGISGWVKNLPGGDVEIEAEGPEDTLDVFIDKLRSGHSFARVDDLEIERLSSGKEKHTGFSIVF